MKKFGADRGEPPTTSEIERVVGMGLRIKRRVKEASGVHVLADCPFNGCKQHLYVNVESGLWDCKKCEEAGNIWRLADHLGIRLRDTQPRIVKQVGSALVAGARAKANRVVTNAKGIDLAGVQAACDRLFAEDDKAGARVGEYLRKVRGLDDETIRRFQLGVTWIKEGGCKPELAVGIPYLDGDKVPLMKIRNLETQKDLRKFRRTAGGYSGLFNAAGIKGCRQVVLVEGELDAISLWQLGIHNVASTSLGAKKTIPEEWLDALADVEDIVLWYDSDDKGQEAAGALVDQLGSYRCRVASMPGGVEAKDANDLLVKVGGDEAAELARKAVDAALGLTNGNVTTPGTFADALEAEIMGGDSSLGISTGWPSVDRLMRGVRMGELTLVTGHTNAGKTSWVLRLLRNLARQGYPVMASALENGPVAIARKVFQSEFGRPISSIRTDEDRRIAMGALAQLDRDPLYLLDLYGKHPLAKIVDAMTYARHRLGVRYFGLDHLHFLGKSDARQETLDHLDEVLSTLTELTRKLNIHIFLIAHPKGTVAADTIPDGDSIKGTSSAKQTADNGVTVFRSVDVAGDATAKKMKIKDSVGRKIEIELQPRDVLISVWKARHDEAGEGSAVLEFDRRNLCYNEKEGTRDASHEESDANNTPKTVDQTTQDLWGATTQTDDPFAS